MAVLEAVCFDLDSTLCVANQSDEEIHRAVFERAGIEPLFAPADVRAVDPGDIEVAQTVPEFYTNLYRAVLDRQPDRDGVAPGLLQELGQITADVVDETDVSLREGAMAAVESAGERYQLGLITNGSEEIQTRKLERIGLLDAFDTMVFCDPAAGIDPKPSTVPFERALRDLGTGPGATVHVGDSHGADVVGARRAGLTSVWVPHARAGSVQPATPDPAPDHQLDSLGELSTVL